jgi:hypothetical protein
MEIVVQSVLGGYLIKRGPDVIGVAKTPASAGRIVKELLAATAAGNVSVTLPQADDADDL